MNASGAMLAIWLVTRKGIWLSWSGLARIAVYVASSAYGRMLFTATQNAWASSDASFTWPGGKLLDYHWAASDLLIVMIFALVLGPIVGMAGIVLTNAHDAATTHARLSILSIIMYMSAVGVAIVWMKFLGSDLWPHNQLGGYSQVKVFQRWLADYVPFALPQVVSAYVMLIGFMNRWRWAIAAALAAMFLDMVGSGVIGSVAEQLTGKRHGGVVGGASMDRWYYICGRSITVATALSTARLLGVRPIFGSRKNGGASLEVLPSSNVSPDWS